MRRCLVVLVLLMVADVAAAGGLEKETVDRLKAATAYIQVTSRAYLTGQPIGKSGSGFFISKNGYLVTNWHVVQPYVSPEEAVLPTPGEPVQIRVFVHSGKTNEEVHKATVIAVDKKHDIAILATSKTGAVHLPLADTSKLYETIPVWSVGFPLGAKFSVIERGPEATFNHGTISALRHDDQGRLTTIQTDALLESGSSGGPLVLKNGSVVGVAQSIVRRNRTLNFTVPVSYVAALMKRTPLDRPFKAKGSVTFRSTPGGATVYVDGRKVGQTGKEPLLVADLPLGLHQVTIIHPDNSPWVRDLTLSHEGEVTAKLVRNRHLRIFTRPTSVISRPPAEATGKLPAVGKELMAQGFDKREVLKEMEQSTGGQQQNTWYVRDGRLHQHESNSMLHAIYMGKRTWRDYKFSAEVQIKNEENDSRAGLIFRETDRGFYLFRVHRQTDRAQLAYHNKSPFGWFVLGEKKLATDIDGRVIRMAVCARGQNITCLLDDKPVFGVRDQLSASGRVGFYSVESRAAFDNAKVAEVSGGSDHKSKPDSYRTFWFSDTFDAQSKWWISRFSNSKPAEPWMLTDVGGVFMNDDGKARVATMDRYVLTNFMADLILRLGPASKAKASKIGIVFGRRAGEGQRTEMRLVFDASTNKCRLFTRRGDTESQLAQGSAEGVFGTKIARILVQVNGRSLVVLSPKGRLLKYEHSEALPEGRFGIMTQGIKVILHRLTISNPRPIGGE